MPVEEIEKRFIGLDWLSSFRDDPGRAYKPVRPASGPGTETRATGDEIR
jgi:hypothetical protein